MVGKDLAGIKLESTKESLTGQGGFLAFGESLEGMQLRKPVTQQLPAPGSNRGFGPDVFVQALITRHQGPSPRHEIPEARLGFQGGEGPESVHIKRRLPGLYGEPSVRGMDPRVVPKGRSLDVASEGKGIGGWGEIPGLCR